jgi:hypothetical protein
VAGSNAYGQLGAEADDASMEGTSAHPYRARPKRLDLLSSLQVTHVSVGSRHTVAVTREGTVYGFGDNSSGQLCQKDGPSQHSTPVLFLTSVWSAALEHRKIVASACGNRHTLLLSGSVRRSIRGLETVRKLFVVMWFARALFGWSETATK